jgi:geranylgeranyl pyrophosphate synthase
MAFEESDRTQVHSRNDTIQSVLSILRDNKTIAILGDIVDMLAASTSTDIRRLYLHIATIVAFHHYIRVVVHKTGNYKAKKTIVLLEEYKNVLLHGFLNTPLTEDQYNAMRRYTRP